MPDHPTHDALASALLTETTRCPCRPTVPCPRCECLQQLICALWEWSDVRRRTPWEKDTPGQLAQEAYRAARRRTWLSWFWFTPLARQTAWECAALAVREDYRRSLAHQHNRARARQHRWGMGPRDLDITHYEEDDDA